MPYCVLVEIPLASSQDRDPCDFTEINSRIGRNTCTVDTLHEYIYRECYEEIRDLDDNTCNMCKLIMDEREIILFVLGLDFFRLTVKTKLVRKGILDCSIGKRK